VPCCKRDATAEQEATETRADRTKLVWPEHEHIKSTAERHNRAASFIKHQTTFSQGLPEVANLLHLVVSYSLHSMWCRQ
jgi:hypothetical protein